MRILPRTVTAMSKASAAGKQKKAKKAHIHSTMKMLYCRYSTLSAERDIEMEKCRESALPRFLQIFARKHAYGLHGRAASSGKQQHIDFRSRCCPCGSKSNMVLAQEAWWASVVLLFLASYYDS